MYMAKGMAMVASERVNNGATGPDFSAQVNIEVAYATPVRQKIEKLQVPRGTTVAQAIELSGILRDFPDAAKRSGVGIFGRKVTDEHILQEGDRVEIYRPLLIDPKEARRRNARK